MTVSILNCASANIDAEKTLWDVVVVGAGPAGSATATYAAEHKLRVLLLDRSNLPREKVCGCCLSPLALSELERLYLTQGLPMNLDIKFLDRITFAFQGESASFLYKNGGVLSRISLDTELTQNAINSGVTWLPSTKALWFNTEDNLVTLSVTTKDKPSYLIQARRLVLAGGLLEAVSVNTAHAQRRTERNRPQNNRIGLGLTLPKEAGLFSDRHLHMGISPQGYCGIVRLEDGSIDIASAVHPHFLKSCKSPSKLIADILTASFTEATCPVDLAAVHESSIRATPLLTHTTGNIHTHSDRIFRVGDAVSYVEPFTGEGIGWALLSARLAASALIDVDGSLRPARKAAKKYRQTFSSHIQMKQRRCRVIALALRSSFLVKVAVKAAKVFPWLSPHAAGFITGNGVFRGYLMNKRKGLS